MELTNRNAAAFGKPGIEPRWTRGDKDAIGTAYSASSRVWFTLAAGIVNEVYFPTIDRPQIRDLQYLITDGESFLHDERRHLKTTMTELAEHVLGYEITNSDPDGRYRIVKQVTEMDAYERLLVDAMTGDATHFAREDYVEEAWRIVDPVLKAATPLTEYEPETWGQLTLTHEFAHRVDG